MGWFARPEGAWKPLENQGKTRILPSSAAPSPRALRRRVGIGLAVGASCEAFTYTLRPQQPRRFPQICPRWSSETSPCSSESRWIRVRIRGAWSVWRSLRRCFGLPSPVASSRACRGEPSWAHRSSARSRACLVLGPAPPRPSSRGPPSSRAARGSSRPLRSPRLPSSQRQSQPRTGRKRSGQQNRRSRPSRGSSKGRASSTPWARPRFRGRSRGSCGRRAGRSSHR